MRSIGACGYAPDLVCLQASGGLRLRKLLSSYPDGWAGAGLILLRLAVALPLVQTGSGLLLAARTQPFSALILGCSSLAVAAAVLIGVLTPAAALLAAAFRVVLLASALASPGAYDAARSAHDLESLLAAGALALLGPGAWSLDARLFGRREIVIPPRSQKP
jgi:uncharacterized membrane protein YphA (DoxX/SURF4 family)